MKKNLFILFLFFISLSFSQPLYIPENGDLLFQDIDCGEFCEAIEKVTYGINGKDFSHVGMVYIENNKTFVLEAGGKGVTKTPLDSFLNRSCDANDHPKIIAGRLKDPYKYTIPKAIEKSLSLLGKKYDYTFDITNDTYYCSELIYYAYSDSTGKSLFELSPMTFKDPDTNETFPAWQAYFEKLKLPVPEGKPGLNPGGISRSDKIKVVYSFY